MTEDHTVFHPDPAVSPEALAKYKGTPFPIGSAQFGAWWHIYQSWNLMCQERTKVQFPWLSRGRGTCGVFLGTITEDSCAALANGKW